MGLNPFEVREVLQDQKIFKQYILSGLNPFEVREVLQVKANIRVQDVYGLNPFEVREVLQDEKAIKNMLSRVSIPLKSGRCCKGMSCW